MHTKPTHAFIKLIALGMLTIPLLSACFKEKAPDVPFDELMRNAKQGIVDTEFGSLHFEALLKGRDAKEKIEGAAEIDFMFDRSGDTPEQQVHLVGQGEWGLDDEVREMNVDITFLEAKGVVQDQLFMRLDALGLTENADFEKIKPILQPYLKKWIKVPPEQLPESFQQFQVQQDLLQQEKETARQIFVSTKLFDMQEYHGVEKAGAQKVDSYHYTVTLNEAGVKSYNQQVARALGNEELTEEQVQQATAGLKYIRSLDLWMDTQTHRVVQAKLLLGGEDLIQGLSGEAMKLDIEVNMTSDFSTPVSLEAPADFVDLDALFAFTQAAQLPAVQEVELEENPESSDVQQESPQPADTQDPSGAPTSSAGPQGFDSGE